MPEKKLSFANVHYFAAGASLFGNDAQVAYQYADKEYAGRNMHAPGFAHLHRLPQHARAGPQCRQVRHLPCRRQVRRGDPHHQG